MNMKSANKFMTFAFIGVTVFCGFKAYGEPVGDLTNKYQIVFKIEAEGMENQFLGVDQYESLDDCLKAESFAFGDGINGIITTSQCELVGQYLPYSIMKGE